MPIKFISNVCVRLTKPMSDSATEITVRTDDAVKLNQLGVGNYTYLVFSYNGNSEVVKYTHTATIPASTKNTVITVERDVEATGVYNFPMKTCGCVDTSASAVIDLATQSADEQGTTLVDCSGNEVPDGAAVVLCDTYNAGQAAQDATIAQKVNNTVYLAGQAAQDAAIATKVDTATYNADQAAQDAAIARKQNALNDCSGNPLAGTVPTCAQMNTAISSAIAGVDDVLEFPTRADFPTTGESGKIYIDAATNTPYRWTGTTYVDIASDKQTLSISGNVVTISGGNSIILPEQESAGLDCAAIGELDVRPYREGDSVLVHNNDGTCARMYAKPGIFTDVRVGMVTQYRSVFTGSPSDIITTVQNVADSKATVRVTIMKPDAVVISEVISKPNGVTVTKVSDGVFDISNLGYGEKVLITNKMRFEAEGNYGFSATLTISEDGLFDYSTNDDYASTSVTVANASEGNPTEECPLAVVYGAGGTTKLPVFSTSTNYRVEHNVIILTDDVTPVSLPTENVTTILAHLQTRVINDPSQNDSVFDYGNYSTYMMPFGTSLTSPDYLGVTLTGTTINIPPPPAGLYAHGVIELKVGPNCNTQILRTYIIRKSDLHPKRGVITVSPTPSGGSIEYAVEATDATVDLYVVDKTTTNRNGSFGIFTRTATVTVPAGTAYNGIATLSGNISQYTSIGAITLTPNGTADAVTIAVSSAARPVDSIVDFYNCLNISITE